LLQLCDFRVNDSQSLQAADFCKRLVRDYKAIDQILAREVEGDGELQGIERSQTSCEAVTSDKEFGSFQMLIGETVNFDLALPRRASTGRAGFRRSFGQELQGGP
jgi:hypothetical protein